MLAITGDLTYPLPMRAYSRPSSCAPTSSACSSYVGGAHPNTGYRSLNFWRRGTEVTQRGLTFVFAPYAVGPYAQGAFFVTVPFARVQSLLNPAFSPLTAGPP